MYNELFILSIVFVPLIGAFILPFAGRFSSRLRNILALVFVLVSLVLSLKLVPQVMAGNMFTVKKSFFMGLDFVLTADCLAVFMAIVSSLVGAVIVLYSFGYISHYENQNEYYLMVVLFLGSMMGIIFSANLIFLYIFWELTAIVSWRLIGFFRAKTDVARADKAFLMTFFGALVMLIAFISLYGETGSFDLSVIREALKTKPLSNLVILLILFGIFSKSATLPFHTWLPDAGVAPSPVTALLHAAVLVKIGVYIYARLFVSTFTVGEVWHTVVPAVAALSTIVAAGSALIDTDIKRIIAYSTISQIGFIFFGLAIGNVIGVAGGLLYILMHGLAKAGLFLSAGVIEQNTKTKDITKLGGLIHTMPVTAVSFLFCAFSIMGIPPFGGFFSKYMVFMGSVESGKLFLTFAFLTGAFLTILYLFRLFNLVFLGDVKSAGREGSTVMVLSVAILAALSLLGGVFISYPAHFARLAAVQMLGLVR